MTQLRSERKTGIRQRFAGFQQVPAARRPTALASLVAALLATVLNGPAAFAQSSQAAPAPAPGAATALPRTAVTVPRARCCCCIAERIYCTHAAGNSSFKESEIGGLGWTRGCFWIATGRPIPFEACR